MRLDRNLRARTNWRGGRAAGSAGPFLVSYTEFTPHTLRDVPAIYLAARKLIAAISQLEGAVGVTTYWQLREGRGGSLSVWENEAALRQFVRLPYHVEIMRKFRTRGSMRAVDWQSDSFDLAQALADGQGAL
jgi:hypothetical protein